MLIGLAQIKPSINNIEANIENHIFWIQQSINQEVKLVLFPELSISNYLPKFCVQNAFTLKDKRLEIFQELSNIHDISIGLGLPIKSKMGVTISMVLFQKDKVPYIYSKQFLHEDEFTFFVKDSNRNHFPISKISPAICYESTIEQHYTSASKNGAQLYMVSVAKSINGISRNRKHLQLVANKYSMDIAHVNYVGDCGEFTAGGQSCIINKEGEILAMLNAKEEGLLIYEWEAV